MGYSTKNTAKHERKQGMAAMRALVEDPNFDPQATLALAQQELDNFKKLDEMANDQFCDCMRVLRDTRPDVYAAFWWWRDAETKAGRRKEEDGGEPETRYRTFMITQFLRAPFSDEWEDDRKTLKPGVEPWITEEQIAEGLDHKTIKQWAWIWHDRDIYTEEDEITDRENRVKAGELKFKHAHIMIDVPSKFPISTVARWFKVPPQQVTVLRGRGAFLDGVEYLVHESPRALEQFKTHYDDDEIHASPGFDFRKELTDLQAHRAKYGKRAGEMTPADTMRMHVMHDGWNMKQCRDDDPLTYAKIRSSLPPLRLDYLLDSPPCPFRLNIYVDGPGGTGKSSFCRYIAQTMFKNTDSPYFRIGNDARVTFDGYDGQPAIIWDDMRAVSLIKQFGREGVFRLFDPHPDQDAQQAKHSRIILCNMLNIINGVEPYKDFIAGLAGTYTDRDGRKHEAEDENQAWRRFPLILCVRMDDFAVLFNKGFVDDDLSSIKTMQQYAFIRGSMKEAMEKLSGEARDQALLTFGEPVETAVKMITDAHDAKKISDPALVPPGLMPVVEYQAADFAQASRDAGERAAAMAEYRAIKAAEEHRFLRHMALMEFGWWFWSCTYGGLSIYLQAHPAELENYLKFLDVAQAQLDRGDSDFLKSARPKLGLLEVDPSDQKPHCLMEYIDNRRNFFLASDLKSEPWKDCSAFSDAELPELVDYVMAAYHGVFGRFPLLSDDPGFPVWINKYYNRPDADMPTP